MNDNKKDSQKEFEEKTEEATKVIKKDFCIERTIDCPKCGEFIKIRIK